MCCVSFEIDVATVTVFLHDEQPKPTTVTMHQPIVKCGKYIWLL